MQRAASLSGNLTLDADVVVVGSGAGGAVVASELSRAGQRVIILEEGDHIPPSRYAGLRPSESLRLLWRDAGMTFAGPIGDTPAINVTMGRCVGGSSVLTGGVCFRTPGAVLKRWREERGLPALTEDDMDVHFSAVERTVHVEEVPESMRSRSTVLFGEGARQLGFELKPTRRNTRHCEGLSRCNFGCPRGAKLSVDVSYLPIALAHGAQLFANCLVDRVSIRGHRAVGVEGRVLNGANGRRGGKLRVHARRVVLAAGAYHSPLILLRSGIGRSSRQVGRNLTLHPSFRVMARFAEPVRGWQGALQSAFSDAFAEEGLTLISMFTPPGILAATLPGIGPEHHRQAAAIPHLAVFGGLIHDEGGGRVRRGWGREPFVTYRMARKDRAAVSRLMKVMAETFFAAGAKEVFLPILGSPGMSADSLRQMELDGISARRLECTSQHPLGTCRMGASPFDSVVDGHGRSWDVDELYVADGSVLPTSLGVNPQLTVMAMARRIAAGMSERPLPPG